VIYEQARAQALQPNGTPPSWALERVRRYGVVGLLPGAQQDFPFILFAQSAPRPAWSGKRDVHRETLHRVYACLLPARAAREDGDTVEPIIGTVATSGRISDAIVKDVPWLGTVSGVTYASGAVCPGVQ
jgi:hypothetical protein